MLGSSQSIAGPNIALNTIMAEELGKFADVLEKAEDFDTALQTLVCKTLTEHSRIIFGGNGYSEAWKEEAGRRGLSNYPSAAEALPTYIQPKNIDLVTRRGIYTESEFHARYIIHLESYNKIVNIEARTMVDMAQHQILPAALHYTHALCDTVNAKGRIGAACKAESAMIADLSTHTDALYDAIYDLKKALTCVPKDPAGAARYYHDTITAGMTSLRTEADILETLTDKAYWPYPTYSDLLFY